LAQALPIPDLGHQLFGPLVLGPEPNELAHGGGPGDPIDGHSGIALEVTEGGRGEVAEDPVDPAGIEAQGTEPLLQLGHVIASDHGGSAVQETVAQSPARLDQGRPGLWTTDAVDPETPAMLESFDSCSGAVTELALEVDGAGQAEGVEPGLYVGDRCS
jgi:hypothetical protein